MDIFTVLELTAVDLRAVRLVRAIFDLLFWERPGNDFFELRRDKKVVTRS